MNKIKTSRLKIFFLLLFIYACTGEQGNPSNNDDIVENSHSLSIISWNIELFPKQGDQTVNEVANIIQYYSPDILALQEINSENQYFDILNNQLDDYSGFIQNNGTWSLSFLYKIDADLEFISISEIYSDNSYAFPRPPLILQMLWNDDHIYIINNHFKCCDDFDRRLLASQLLDEYIETYLDTKKVIIIGDLNDSLDDSENENAFLPFINNTNSYILADFHIATGLQDYWSFPNYPSHIDHIILTSELYDIFNNEDSSVETLLLDIDFYNNWDAYDEIISDHRPMYLILNP